MIVIQFQVDSVSALLMTRAKLKTLLHSYKMWLMDMVGQPPEAPF
jgi:hypothetical protein